MIINKDNNNALFQIRAYQPGAITVNEQIYTHSLIITAQNLITDWPPQSLSEITAEHWQTVLNLNPEIILLGTGLKFIMPHPSLLAPIHARRIGIESMDTRAACRTFMALLSEERSVAAVLCLT